MSWSINNNAHKALWALIGYFHRIGQDGNPFTTFEEGGQWKCGYCIKSAHGESPEVIEGHALATAQKLDDLFVGVFKTQYEPGKDQDAAVAAMTAAFIRTESKLETVGDIVDNHYRFRGEIIA